MTKRKPKVIKDKKLRGEWAESVFMERATQHGLAVSKPWGEMCSYDFVIGKTGRFVSVQVKSTTEQFKDGFVCTVRGGHKAYPSGSFDFLAAYAVPDDAWYIIPLELIRGKKSITLFPKSKTAKYEAYREAWHLLKEAAQSGLEEDAHNATAETGVSENAPGADGPSGDVPAARFPAGGLGRAEAAFDFARRYMEANYPRPRKREEE